MLRVCSNSRLCCAATCESRGSSGTTSRYRQWLRLLHGADRAGVTRKTSYRLIIRSLSAKWHHLHPR